MPMELDRNLIFSSPTLPAPRTNSLGRAKTDCHTCSQNRRACDRQRPRCGTCLQRGILCGGYALDLTWTTSNTGRSSKLPPGHEPPLLSPYISGEIGTDTGTSPKAPSATPAPTRQFKFKVGKPKKPRKKPHQGGSTGGAAKVKEDINSVSEDFSHPCEDQPATLERDKYDARLSSTISTGIWEAVLPSRVQELSDFSIDPNEDFRVVDELEEQSLVAAVPAYELPGCYISSPSISHFPLFGSIEDKYSGVLQKYDKEFCIRPLTSDCTLNPFRCSEATSRGSRFLLHAMMALSSHLMSTSPKDKEAVAKTLNHKSVAIQLYREALSRSETRNLALLDTLLILITLEAAQGALSTWNVHLAGAYNLIEAAGGVKILTFVPRLNAQVTMLLWWDTTIGLISRRGLIFSKSYLDAIVTWANKDAQPFFHLTGCPADLVVCMAKLARLASAYEQSQGLEWTASKLARIEDLEATLMDWYNPYQITSNVSDVQEDCNPIQDYYHCAEAWRHALILYIYQVFRRDLTMKSPAPTLYYSRIILDHIQCIRQETVVQKQVLLPLFLAGCEATDEDLRKQAKAYCLFWSQRNGYHMFQNVGELLEHVWKDRVDGQYWWGDTVDQYNSKGPTDPMRSQFLFG